MILRLQDFSRESNVMETARELELQLKPEDRTELLQSHDKTLMKSCCPKYNT